MCALVAVGMENDEIAKITKSHPTTVSKQIFIAREVLGVETRIKLAIYIVRCPKLERKLRATLPEVFIKEHNGDLQK